MRILVSNDDGVSAPGIRALSDALSTIAKVKVIAPDRNRSGASSSLTLSRPLHVTELENGYHSVDGTPTDCVHLALSGYFDEPFDMVVSGINDGANLADDILYSGTVAAAMEGRQLGLPAIAMSLVGRQVKHFRTAAEIAKQLVMKLASHKLPQGTILNVNVPDVPIDAIKGILITRSGRYHASEPLIKSIDPRGHPVYWIGPSGSQADAVLGTDFDAINRGFVSVTPLQIDMTQYKLFSHLSEWIDGVKLTS